jgi:DNA invertase Pin-like site-specific DNA recombinase
MLNVLGSVAEFERSMMLERQREGIAKAKAEGKYKGRAPGRPARPRGRRDPHANSSKSRQVNLPYGCL